MAEPKYDTIVRSGDVDDLKDDTYAATTAATKPSSPAPTGLPSGSYDTIVQKGSLSDLEKDPAGRDPSYAATSSTAKASTPDKPTTDVYGATAATAKTGLATPPGDSKGVPAPAAPTPLKVPATPRAVVASINGDPMGHVSQTAQQIHQLVQERLNDKEYQEALKNLPKSAEEAEQTMASLKQHVEQLGFESANALKPWDADAESAKYSHTPMEKFGSAGMIFALVAGAFTHQPMINALNGATAAMNAIQTGDDQAYKKAYEAWTANTDLVIKRNNLMLADYQEIGELAMKQPELAAAKVKALAAKYDDPVAALQVEQGSWEKYEQLLMTRASTMAQVAEARARMIPYDLYYQWLKENPNATLDEKHQKFQQFTTAGSFMSQDMLQSMGAQEAGGEPENQVVVGFGKGILEQRQQVKAEAIRQIMAEPQNKGMTAIQAGQELSRRQVEWLTGKSTNRQLGMWLTATQVAVGQLDYNLSRAQQLMKDMPGSDLSPLINAYIKGAEYWTGDPKYQSAFFAIKAAAAESARIMSGGQMSNAMLPEGARAEAQHFLDMGWVTPEQLFGPNGVASTMRQEGQNKIDLYNKAINEQERRFGHLGTDVVPDDAGGAIYGEQPGSPTSPPPAAPSGAGWSIQAQ